VAGHRPVPRLAGRIHHRQCRGDPLPRPPRDGGLDDFPAGRVTARRNQNRRAQQRGRRPNNIKSLLAARELIARTPTWPWSSGTFRGFSTAVLLPILLWRVLRILERVLV
jgi:hypothetical protein